jgi:hypothetical protein
MNWKTRYTEEPIAISNDNIKIYKDHYYIMTNGDEYVRKVSCGEGYIVRIHNISKDGYNVWFGKQSSPYTWISVYSDYVIREATEQEVAERIDRLER